MARDNLAVLAALLGITNRFFKCAAGDAQSLAATNTRDRSNSESVLRSPSPSLPIMLEAGTRTSVRKICAVDWLLKPILWMPRTS